MLVLAFESSAKAASVALMQDEKLLGQSFQNTALTHSQTLLPMAENMLKMLNIKLSDIDLFAVARGPGSFTGLRIGVSTIKGLAWALEKPVCGVSSLEAMANLAMHVTDGIICCAMDARRSEVYNALFEINDGKITRLCEDRAISIAELANDIKERKKAVYIVGDGASLCYNSFKELEIPNITLAPEYIRYQNAYAVATSALVGEVELPDELAPVYLRLSQAERERNERMKNMEATK